MFIIYIILYPILSDKREKVKPCFSQQVCKSFENAVKLVKTAFLSLDSANCTNAFPKTGHLDRLHSSPAIKGLQTVEIRWYCYVSASESDKF